MEISSQSPANQKNDNTNNKAHYNIYANKWEACGIDGWLALNFWGSDGWSRIFSVD